MRVISGQARGRQLRAGKGPAIRPTASKVRGAIFNILTSRWSLEDAEVLDLFSGAGSLGIEALSRGARCATFIENDRRAVHILRRNLEQCGLTARARVLAGSVPAVLRRLAAGGAKFDGVLLDPPYGKGWVARALQELAEAGVVRPGGWVVVEHSIDELVDTQFGELRLTQDRRYGKTALAILVADAETETGATT